MTKEIDLIPLLEAKAKELERAAATIRETIHILSEHGDIASEIKLGQCVRVRPIKRIYYTNRFISLFTEVGRFLHSTEINELLPGIKHLSSALHTAKTKQNKIVSAVIGSSKNNTVWGLPDWLNPDGTIVIGREPKRYNYIRYGKQK